MSQIKDYNSKYRTAAGGSAAAHSARGSYGIDRLAPMQTGGKSTPIRALQSGALVFRHDAYNTADIHGAHGVVTEQKEIRSPIGGNRHVEQGEVIGYVGLHRENQNKSPHDGARWPGGCGTPAQAQAYITKLERAAAARAKRARAAKAAAAKKARRAEVKRIAAELNRLAKSLRLPKTAAAYNGIPGSFYYRLEQKYGRAHGLYTGRVTGINNTATKKVDAYLAEHTK
jgi:hypothetical protein